MVSPKTGKRINPPRQQQTFLLTKVTYSIGIASLLGCSGSAVLGTAAFLGLSAAGYWALKNRTNQRPVEVISQPGIKHTKTPKPPLSTTKPSSLLLKTSDLDQSEVIEIEPSIKDILDQDKAGQYSKAVGLLYDYIRDISLDHRQNKLDRINLLFIFLSAKTVSTDLATALLSATWQIKNELPNRSRYYDEVAQRIRAEGDDPDEELDGLK